MNNSFLGEDAFYRDAHFYDCEEGTNVDDDLFARAREQATLKMRKGRVLAKYASFTFRARAHGAREHCMGREQAESVSPSRTRASSSSIAPGGFRLGTTIPQWSGDGLPPTGEGPYWSHGEGRGLKVRCGPNYIKMRQKTEAQGSMYEAISIDAIKANSKIETIMGRFVKELPPQPPGQGESDRGGGDVPKWTSDCKLPRVIFINMMIPYTTGMNPFGKQDGGMSFVGVFHIKPETLLAARSEHPPVSVKLLQAFCQGPAGLPGGAKSEPSRSLNERVVKGVKQDAITGLLKACAQCVNPEDVHVPDMFHTYNGKPCLITKSGSIVRDPSGEWMEIGIDVRRFNILARKMLCSFRNLLPRTKIQYGFLVQGVKDEELPEGLICNTYIHGVDMINDPLDVSDEAADEANEISAVDTEEGEDSPRVLKVQRT